MSIIQEALKKAEAKTMGTEAAQPERAESPRAQPAAGAGPESTRKAAPDVAVRRAGRAAPAGTRYAALAAAIAIALISVAAATVMQRADRRPPAPEVARVEQPAPAVDDAATAQADKASPEAGPVSTIPLTEKSGFELNGIMYIEGDPRAIVNNSMVEVGDTVSGARVARIERRAVFLDKSGEEIRLDLN